MSVPSWLDSPLTEPISTLAVAYDFEFLCSDTIVGGSAQKRALFWTLRKITGPKKTFIFRLSSVESARANAHKIGATMSPSAKTCALMVEL